MEELMESSSSSAAIYRRDAEVVDLIASRVEHGLGLADQAGTYTQLLGYEVGGEYGVHTDCHPSWDRNHPSGAGGMLLRRAASLLIYLTDSFGGDCSRCSGS
eukprot:TRINITY_DN44192_c0_g1_i1.p4 TRINITY_DN44192_c0_g1~~TRINITY_DN44192_c0_g1_i1.p4  ORF type:complete len:102 (+),score=18.52 TRINITY_DN44192_c0_g1_i1:190-495(+)